MQKKWAVCLFFMLCCMHNIIGDGLSAGIDHVCTIVMRVCPQAAPIIVVAKTAAKCVGLGLGKFVIDKIRNYRQRKKDARYAKSESKKQIKEACFEVSQDPITVHTYPVVKDAEQPIACQILVLPEEQSTSPGCMTVEDEGQQGVHVFPIVENKEPLVLLQQVGTEVDSEHKQYPGPWYDRTEDWIKEHPFGQKIAKHLERSRYTNQGKRAFKVTKNIDDCSGFKKGDYVVVDGLHKDHLEVFDSDGDWKQVANFDGSKNVKKTDQVGKRKRAPLW